MSAAPTGTRNSSYSAWRKRRSNTWSNRSPATNRRPSTDDHARQPGRSRSTQRSARLIGDGIEDTHEIVQGNLKDSTLHRVSVFHSGGGRLRREVFAVRIPHGHCLTRLV